VARGQDKLEQRWFKTQKRQLEREKMLQSERSSKGGVGADSLYSITIAALQRRGSQVPAWGAIQVYEAF